VLNRKRTIADRLRDAWTVLVHDELHAAHLAIDGLRDWLADCERELEIRRFQVGVPDGKTKLFGATDRPVLYLLPDGTHTNSLNTCLNLWWPKIPAADRERAEATSRTRHREDVERSP